MHKQMYMSGGGFWMLLLSTQRTKQLSSIQFTLAIFIKSVSDLKTPKYIFHFDLQVSNGF